MKKFLLLLALSALPLIAGANLIPNGDFKDPKGKKVHIRIPRNDAKAAYKKNVILAETASPNGLVELNCHNLTGIRAGVRTYLRMSFERKVCW